MAWSILFLDDVEVSLSHLRVPQTVFNEMRWVLVKQELVTDLKDFECIKVKTLVKDFFFQMTIEYMVQTNCS